MTNDYLVHYALGRTAAKHKYIAKVNGRYIYPSDAKAKTVATPKVEKKEVPVDTTEDSIIEKIENHNEEVRNNNQAIDDAIKNDYAKSKQSFDSWLRKTSLGKFMSLSIGDIIYMLKHSDEGDARVEDYLAHHGILGQKHGVQNGPPYPLSGNQLSAAEAKKSGVSDSAKEKYSAVRNKIKKAPKADVPAEKVTVREVSKSEVGTIPMRMATATEVWGNRERMTNKELQDYLTRADLYQRLGKMKQAEWESSHKAQMFVKKYVDRAVDNGINALMNYGQSTVKTMLDEMIDGKPNFAGPALSDIAKNPDAYSSQDIKAALERQANIDKLKNYK